MELHSRGELNFYVARVILNQMQSSTSPFYNTYRKILLTYDEVEWDESEGGDASAVRRHNKNVQIIATEKHNIASTGQKIYETADQDDQAIEDRIVKELVEDYTLEQINHLPFYESEMVKLYMKAGSYRSMERATRIPHESCHKTVRKALNKLRKMGEIKKAKNIFTKEEIEFIKNNK